MSVLDPIHLFLQKKEKRKKRKKNMDDAKYTF